MFLAAFQGDPCALLLFIACASGKSGPILTHRQFPCFANIGVKLLAPTQKLFRVYSVLSRGC